jgi:tetratricopeptide (TPR) repeat protein
MQRAHIIAILASVLILIVLLFGFDKVPKKSKELEKSRSISMEATGVQNLLKEAIGKLNSEQKTIIEALNMDVEQAEADSVKVNRLKTLASTWFEYDSKAISAFYAEEIAIIQKTEEAWSIAGTTYALCVKSVEDKKIKEFCSKRSLQAFENAISLDPEKIEPKINQALVFIDYPQQDNPMKGILMLRELNEQYPENVSVLNQLGRLAIQTNQTDKALERLEKALSLEPNNRNTICLLSTAYEQANQVEKAEEYKQKCINN